MKSFYWMQHFSKIINFDSSPFLGTQEYMCLSYFLGNRKKYFRVVKRYGDFLISSSFISNEYINCFSENSKEWNVLNFPFCKYMLAKGLDYDKIFCLCRDKGLYK